MARKSCTIIAAGNSLRGFDFSLLDKHFKIGINTEVPKHVKCDWVAAWDHISAHNLFNSPFQSKLHTLGNWGLPLDQVPFQYINEGTRISKNPYVIQCNSSAAFALNIAYNHGFNDITLLGCDNTAKIGEPFHFYDEIFVTKDIYDMHMVHRRGSEFCAFENFARAFATLRAQMPSKVRITAVESELSKQPFGVDTGIKGVTMEEYINSITNGEQKTRGTHPRRT